MMVPFCLVCKCQSASVKHWFCIQCPMTFPILKHAQSLTPSLHTHQHVRLCQIAMFCMIWHKLMHFRLPLFFVFIMRMMRLDTDNKWLVLLNDPAKLKILRGDRNLVKPCCSRKASTIGQNMKALGSLVMTIRTRCHNQSKWWKIVTGRQVHEIPPMWVWEGRCVQPMQRGWFHVPVHNGATLLQLR